MASPTLTSGSTRPKGKRTSATVGVQDDELATDFATRSHPLVSVEEAVGLFSLCIESRALLPGALEAAAGLGEEGWERACYLYTSQYPHTSPSLPHDLQAALPRVAWRAFSAGSGGVFPDIVGGEVVDALVKAIRDGDTREVQRVVGGVCSWEHWLALSGGYLKHTAGGHLGDAVRRTLGAAEEGGVQGHLAELRGAERVSPGPCVGEGLLEIVLQGDHQAVERVLSWLPPGGLARLCAANDRIPGRLGELEGDSLSRCSEILLAGGEQIPGDDASPPTSDRVGEAAAGLLTSALKAGDAFGAARAILRCPPGAAAARDKALESGVGEAVAGSGLSAEGRRLCEGSMHAVEGGLEEVAAALLADEFARALGAGSGVLCEPQLAQLLRRPRLAS
eukprot:Hpha_TRINITY_DN8619_c0_g2::TRINITY_DN8619_c0_g2_i1::g.168828::m.168828